MRVEQEHAARLIHVTDVQAGDLIDTEGWWPEGSTEALVADTEYSEVAGIEVETDECVRIDFEGMPSYGWPTSQPIVVQRRYNHA